MAPNDTKKSPESPLQATAATLRLVGLYAIFSCLWVLFSDQVVESLLAAGQAPSVPVWEKGLFVAATLLLFWMWTRRLIKQVKIHSDWENQMREESQHTDRCLAAIVESSTDAIIAKDLRGRYLIFNPEATRITGKNSASVLGQDDSAVFPAARAELVRAHDRQIIAKNQLHVYEETLMTASGERTYLSTKGPLCNNNGQVIGIFGIFHDITERKHAEEVLRKDEANFRSLFEDNSSPMLLVDHAAGEIIDANMAALSFYGYPKEQFLHMRVSNFDPASPESTLQALQRVGERKAHYLKHRLASGEVRDVELHATHIDRDGRSILLSIIHDITQRKKAEQSLSESEERLRLALTASKQGWFDIDLKNGHVRVSHEYLNMTGYEHHEFQSTLEGLLSYAHPEDRNAVFSTLLARSKDGEPFTIEYRQRRKSGDYRWVRSVGKAVEWDARHSATRLIGIQADITERKELEDQIRQLAFFDPLTALPNRRLLHDRLHHAMAASKRSGRYCAILFSDLDNFKPLNDRHGHEAGDLLLIEVAYRLRNCVREIDTVARFGGDEFVIMICELGTDKKESLAQAHAVAEKIRIALAKPYAITIQEEGKEGSKKTIEHHCSASIGITLFIDQHTSQTDVLKEADLAMYAAKDAGRNMIRFYSNATEA